MIGNGILIFIVALIIWIFSMKGDKNEETIQDNHLIKIGVDLLPHEFGIDSTGTIIGFQKQLMVQLLPQDSLSWIPYNSREEAIDALRKEEIQIYATSLPYSVRQEYQDIIATEWLYHSKFSLLFHKEDIHWEDTFTGTKEVNVTISSGDKVVELMLKNLKELSYPAINIDIRKESPLQLGVLLVKREIDFLVCNSQLAASIAEMDSTLLVSENFTIDTQQVWLVNSKDTALLGQLNKKILEKRDSKDWTKIIENNLR